MWLIGLIALVMAGFFGILLHRARSHAIAMITTDQFSARELAELQQAATEAAGAGYFRLACALVGAAQPGPSGLTMSEISRTACVWHRHVVTRRYWVTERGHGSHHRDRRVEKTEKITESASEQPFAVQDATGSTLVRPASTMRHVPKIVDRFEPSEDTSRGTEFSIGSFRLSLPRVRREGTIGYRYEEWVLPPGQRLYVLGEVTDSSGQLMIDRPTLVSTKTEDELLHESRSRQRLLTLGSSALAVLGVVLVLVSLVG